MRRAVRSTSKLDCCDDCQDPTMTLNKVLHPDNDDKERRKFPWRSLRWQSFTYLLMDSPHTRRVALVLIVLHVMLLGAPTSAGCMNEAISSFRTWRSRRQWPLPPTYISPSISDLRGRPNRFPSVQTRIKHYMGYWYEPALQGEPPQPPFGPFWNDKYQALKITTRDSPWNPERLAYEPIVNPLDMNPDLLLGCSLGKYTKTDDYALIQACNADSPMSAMVRRSIRDLLDAALLVKSNDQLSTWTRMWNILFYEGFLGWIMEWPMIFRRWQQSNYPTKAFLWSLGIGTTKATNQWNVQTPVFSRVRDLLAERDWKYQRHRRLDDDKDCSQCGSQHTTILWPLQRDALMETLIKVPEFDVPFETKEGKLVWRGNLLTDVPTAMANIGSELPLMQQPIALLKKYASHPFVDAKFIMHTDQEQEKIFPDSFYSKPLTIDAILKHKYLLSLEGADSSMNLLWMMFSNSVVFLANATYATWVMEDLLEPYVHYIPVHSNMSNVADQVRWAQSNPDRCREIAKRSTLYVFDMLFHPQAIRDEDEILRAIIHRYEQYVLNAKPIIHWSHIFGKLGSNLNQWLQWLTEDWLRIAFAVILLILLCQA